MKRYLILLLLLVSAVATANLPTFVNDGDSPTDGGSFWCDGQTMSEGRCEAVLQDVGGKYLLVREGGNETCPNGFYSYINLQTNTGYTVNTKVADFCQPDITLSFFKTKAGNVVIGLIKNKQVVEVVPLH